MSLIVLLCERLVRSSQPRITIQGLEYMTLLRKSGQIQLFDSEGVKFKPDLS